MNVEIVVPGAARLGESPVWDAAEGALWWVDITGGILHRFDPATGDSETEVGAPLACVAPRAMGGLVCAQGDGFALLDPATGETEPLAQPEAHRPENRFNDGALDRQGRFLAGTMGPGRDGAFYTLFPDGAVTCWREAVHTTNGLALSPDGRTLYHSDSRAPIRTVWRSDYDPDDGRVGPPEVFLDTAGLPGRPDGGCVDADGCYWSAAIEGGELVRVTPDGRIDRTVEIPTPKPTKPAWGGPDLDVLYVTSIGDGEGNGGALFAVTGLGTTGVPETPFAG